MFSSSSLRIKLFASLYSLDIPAYRVQNDALGFFKNDGFIRVDVYIQKYIGKPEIL